MYYNKVREQVEKAGYPVVDFSGHEYDKYFLKDTIHLGWKGWIYFDEAVQKFYSENSRETGMAISRSGFLV